VSATKTGKASATRIRIEIGEANAPAAGLLHVKAAGSIGRDAHLRVRDAVMPMAGPNWRSMRLVLDLGDATFMDSSGISSLLCLRDEMNRESGSLSMCSVPAQLDRMFEVVGMLNLIPVVASPDGNGARVKQ